MEFSINQEPLKTEDIKMERSRLLNEKTKQVLRLFAGIIVGTILFIGTMFIDAYAAFFILIGFTGIYILFFMPENLIRIDTEIQMLEPVEGYLHTYALVLCRKHIELDAYLQKIEGNRKFMNGEYQMMVKWDEYVNTRTNEINTNKKNVSIG